MRELCLPEDLHPGLTGLTGPERSDRSRDRSETANPSYELYFDTEFVRVTTPNGYKPPHPIYMKDHTRLR